MERMVQKNGSLMKGEVASSLAQPGRQIGLQEDDDDYDDHEV